jgi:hypothetical protein
MTEKQTTLLREKWVSSILIILLGVLTLHLVGEGFFGPHAADRSGGTAMLPAGWTASGPWEVYPAGRMYEKIDGREPLFQQYGALRLRYIDVSKDGDDFEIYVYDMKSADGALGIYLANTPSKFDDLDLGTMADVSGGQVRVLRGKTYLEVLALAEKLSEKTLVELAAGLTKNMPEEKEAQRTAVDLLPRQGRIRGSLILNRENTYGLSKLTDIFSASYKLGDDEFDFLIRKISPTDSRKMLSALAEEIREFDGKIFKIEQGVMIAEFMGKTLILKETGDFLVGINGSLDPKRSEQTLDGWIESMKEESHGPGR